jgi:hypothetical protein
MTKALPRFLLDEKGKKASARQFFEWKLSPKAI